MTTIEVSGRSRLAALADGFSDLAFWKRLGLALVAYAIALGLFALLLGSQKANPLSVFSSIFQSALTSSGALPAVVLRAVPITLAALATSVPARAGLVNVGGEGQLIVGAVAATGVGVSLGNAVPGVLGWIVMALAGTAAGAVWGGIAGALRVAVNANEAVTTLLLNFIANDLMLYLLYQPWKDPNGSGQPESRPLSSHEVLPHLFGSSINLGVIIALVVALAIWVLLQRSGWGFAIRVVGGNQDAAHRAGLPVKRLLISSMAVGGGLAGLGGMLYLAGTQLQLLPGGTATYGYVAFLAAFLGRHDPAKVVLAALLFAAIAVSAPGLQLSYGLDGSVVDLLLALIVAVPLARSVQRKRAF
jgi:simple sugar transport system permease protein